MGRSVPVPDVNGVVPHWERGDRCHGFWIDMTRLGVIGYGPGRGAASAGGYTWEYGPFPVGSNRNESGWSIDLPSAKRAVMRAHKARFNVFRVQFGFPELKPFR